jgi:hypothetical protein
MNSQTVFDSIDELLAPANLSSLVGFAVTNVSRLAFDVPHRSANELFEIRFAGETGPARLILKVFQPRRDWVMRLTNDSLTREAMLFTHGIYAQMPVQILVPVIAAARHGDTWATLMTDVSTQLLPVNAPLTREQAILLVQHLAQLHSHFIGDASLKEPALGLSSLRDFVTILSPVRVRQELDSGQSHPVLQLADRGWEEFHTQAPADVRSIITKLQSSPDPLLAKLREMPHTLLHGDYKIANLGITHLPPHATVALDWQDAAYGPGTLDLGYFLALCARWLPFSKDRAIELYLNELAARNQYVSLRELELGLLAGGALRLLWLMVSSSPTELDWWYRHIRRAAAFVLS